MKENENNQLLYEWAILQFISLDKWNAFNGKLLEFLLEKKSEEFNLMKDIAREKHSTNQNKLSRAIQAIENERRKYNSELAASFKDYTRLTTKLVNEFKLADNNEMLNLAGEHINNWFKQNFQVYVSEEIEK